MSTQAKVHEALMTLTNGSLIASREIADIAWKAGLSTAATGSALRALDRKGYVKRTVVMNATMGASAYKPVYKIRIRRFNEEA